MAIGWCKYRVGGGYMAICTKDGKRAAVGLTTCSQCMKRGLHKE